MSAAARRIAGFLIVAGALQVSPFAVQVLRYGRYPIPGWRMYQKKGQDICQVRVSELLPDGSRALLPLSSVGVDGVKIRRATDLDAFAERLCRQHPGRDLRLEARCGHWYSGWVPSRDGAKPLCEPAALP
jgi:hypothetical protein